MQISTVLESMALTPTVQESAAYYIGIDKMYNTLKYNHLTIAEFLCLSRNLFLFKLLKSDTLMIFFFLNIIF